MNPRKIGVMVLAAVMLIFAPAAAEEPQNMVVNPWLGLDDEGVPEGWSLADSAEANVDGEVMFRDRLALRITRLSDAGGSGISQKIPGLEPGVDYLFGVWIKTPVEEEQRVTINLSSGSTELSTNNNRAPQGKWYPWNVRLRTPDNGRSAEVSIRVRGEGPAWIAEPHFYRLNTPEKGVDLSDRYLRVPFATFAEGEIHDHLDVSEGTVEFWVSPNWEEAKDGRGFKDEGLRTFFFWGSRHNLNSLSLHNLNRWPNLYFRIYDDNYKAESLLFYHNTPVRGWKKGWWHHVAGTWKADEESIAMELFVDGLSMGRKELVGNIHGRVPDDILVGTGKRGGEVVPDLVAMSEISLFRISDKVRYTETFTPSADYGVDVNTICFLPLSGDEDLSGTFYMAPGEGTIDVNNVPIAE